MTSIEYSSGNQGAREEALLGEKREALACLGVLSYELRLDVALPDRRAHLESARSARGEELPSSA